MKKFLFIALFSIQFIQAQEAKDSTVVFSKKNEIRTDLFSLAADGRINLTYERFLNDTFSIGVSVGFAASSKIDDDFDSGFRNNRPNYDVTPFVRYNLIQNQRSCFFIEAFAAANGGDFKEIVRKTDAVGNGYYDVEGSTYSDLALGGGLGYKLYIADKFGVEFMVGFGGNLIDTDKSPDTVSRVGLSFGYRF